MITIIRYGAAAAALAIATQAWGLEFSRESLDHVMGVCRADYHRVCDDVVPGDGRVWRCLLKHEQQLSPKCLTALKLAYALEACAGDYDRYCRGARKGAESISCLSRRLPGLTPECRRVIEANAGGDVRGPYLAPQTPYPAPYPGGPYAAPYPPQAPGYAYGGAPQGNPDGDDEEQYADRAPAPYAGPGQSPYPQQPNGDYDGRYADGGAGPYSGPGQSPYPQQPYYGGGDTQQGYYGQGDAAQGYYGGRQPYAPPGPYGER